MSSSCGRAPLIERVLVPSSNRIGAVLDVQLGVEGPDLVRVYGCSRQLYSPHARGLVPHSVALTRPKGVFRCSALCRLRRWACFMLLLAIWMGRAPFEESCEGLVVLEGIV